MSDASLYDDKLWAVEKYSERLKRWVRVARTAANPSGLRTYPASVKIADARSDDHPRHGYRVRLIVTNPFKVLEGQFEIVRTSGDQEPPGSHAAGSYHYQPAPWGGVKGYDYGTVTNLQARVVAAARHIRAGTDVGKSVPRYRGRFVAELFGPFPWHVKNGVVKSGQFPKHENHVHLALVT